MTTIFAKSYPIIKKHINEKSGRVTYSATFLHVYHDYWPRNWQVMHMWLDAKMLMTSSFKKKGVNLFFLFDAIYFWDSTAYFMLEDLISCLLTEVIQTVTKWLSVDVGNNMILFSFVVTSLVSPTWVGRQRNEAINVTPYKHWSDFEIME